MTISPLSSIFVRRMKDMMIANRSFVINSFGSLYEQIFVTAEHECPYFSKGMENLGIMLKGKSLELFPRYDQRFGNCFLVNNYDEELKLIGKHLVGKKCVHFVNRLMTAPLHPKNYRQLDTTDVQLSKASAFGDKRLGVAVRHYRSLGLRTHFLPKNLLKFNLDFGKEYSRKHPNTGVLAIIYALEMLRPKTLWIIGLDFYQSDYLIRRAHQNPIEIQREKIERINLVEVTAGIFRAYSDIKINLISYYQGFPEVPNVRVFRE